MATRLEMILAMVNVVAASTEMSIAIIKVTVGSPIEMIATNILA